jgi:hypothetical protein
MAFLTFNPSISTYAEYLLTCVGPFGAGETAQGFVKRILSVTSRTERNCGITSLRVETVYFPLAIIHLMVIWAYLATLFSQGFSHMDGSQCGHEGRTRHLITVCVAFIACRYESNLSVKYKSGTPIGRPVPESARHSVIIPNRSRHYRTGHLWVDSSSNIHRSPPMSFAESLSAW